MSNWIQLGDDTLLNLDKVWHVSPTGGKRKEWTYELCFLVELNFPPEQVGDSTQWELWHEVRENFETREDMMIAFYTVSERIGALKLDKEVEDYKRHFGIKNEEEKTSA